MKKRKVEQVEALEFDPSARQDYLSGFHKRKVARKKAAQETAVKKDREDRIRQRKEIREQRKAELESHVEQVNALLKQADADIRGEDDEDQAEEWNGFETETPVIDKTDEYIDEDKYATVTIKELNDVRDLLDQSDAEDDAQDDVTKASKLDTVESDKAKAKRKARNEEKAKRLKKKRSFKYETKAERQATRHKNSSRNAKAAKARRSA